jgi:hypothetical protein
MKNYLSNYEKMIQQLILMSGLNEIYKYYLLINQQYEKYISFEIYVETKPDISEIVNILDFYCNEASHGDIFYKYAPNILGNDPHPFLIVICKKNFLNHVKMINSIYNYIIHLESKEYIYIIGYLEWCLGISNEFFGVNGNPIESKMIQNVLILLYSKFKEEKSLEEYLFDSNGRKICDCDEIHAISVTKLYHQMRSYCLLISNTGLYDEGIKIAFKVNQFQMKGLV